VRLNMASDTAIAEEVRARFYTMWNNTPDLTYSSDDETHTDESPWLTLQYRFMEATGLSTF